MIVPSVADSEAEDERVLERELGGGEFEEHEVDIVQRRRAEGDELRRDRRERRVEQRAIGQEHRVHQHDQRERRARPISSAPSWTSRGSPCLPPTTE